MKKFLIVSITAILAVSITGCNLVSDTASPAPAASETTSGTTDNISDTLPATPDPEQTSTSETDTAKPAMVIDDDSQIAEKDTTDDATDAPATGDVIKGNEESETIPQDENAPVENTSAESASEKDVSEEQTFNETKAEEKTNEAGTEAFYISEITDDIFARIKGKSFKDNCTLPREDLRYLHVLHKDKDGVTHEGEMIVNYHIAEDVLDILKQLYENDYPIEKIRLVDEYGADDETSMEDNNSSSFNFRFISHTTKVSKHGLGLAVDINTLYNPYTKVVDGKRIIEPITGEPYLDRDADFDYKIEKGDLCYDLFISHGFEWGGSWSDRKDYQHFEIPTSKVNQWYP